MAAWSGVFGRLDRAVAASTSTTSFSISSARLQRPA
jgi:hypothetical protein